jgi:hypothetical protein
MINFNPALSFLSIPCNLFLCLLCWCTNRAQCLSTELGPIGTLSPVREERSAES